MRYFKKIAGDQCYLSPINLEDSDLYTEWLNDLQVTQNLTLSSKNITLHGERVLLEELSKGHNYAIVDSRDDTLIGNCGIMNWDQTHRTGEVGIFIGPKESRGRGIGTEALRLLCGYAFDYMNMGSLFLRVFEFNEAGIRCYEKVGFKRSGLLRDSFIMRGRAYDTILMDCLPSDLIRN